MAGLQVAIMIISILLGAQFGYLMVGPRANPIIIVGHGFLGWFVGYYIAYFLI